MTELIHDIDVVGVRGNPATTPVRTIEFDSRQVQAGSLFCCIRGAHLDGHHYAAEAVGGGATALLCERFLDLGVTQVCVRRGAVRPAMAAAASTLNGYPSRSLTMVGVTGTNGKTTVTALVGSILDHAGIPTGVIGTLDGARTTPEAPVLQRLLAEHRDGGRRAVAMEVSSHGLAEHRVDSIVFDVAAFTNLSRDHLDHHHTMDEYFEAKAGLFDRARVAVVNVDDPWGRRLAGQVDRVPVVEVRRADAGEITLSAGSSSFRWRDRTVTIPLAGMFNVENALMAAAVAASLGVDTDQIAEGLAGVSPVPGRMEVVSSGPPFSVVVDYAHTPAALEAALSAARTMAGGSGRVICLFGCGGDRDQGKRPEMGATASRGSDVVVVTSDNPRSEDPAQIIDQVRAGITGPVEVVVEPDRAEAIAAAVAMARSGDIVVLAGKGHETTQVLADQVVPFDDGDEARRALAVRTGGAGR
jgi:UDP-N-acetylmuramoyl-L-alanyl-D-glutamate--2,6-diaminopimelate ligase